MEYESKMSTGGELGMSALAALTAARTSSMMRFVRTLLMPSCTYCAAHTAHRPARRPAYRK
eukprot:5349545-Pyramimonas_sp.AAC.1